MRAERSRFERPVLRTLVSSLGTLPAAWLVGAALALYWPGEESVRHAVGFVLTLPLWVAAMCVAFLDRRAWRAGLAALVIAALAYAAIRAH